MMPVVSWVGAADARDEHFASWNRNLSVTVDPLRRFQWMYRDNPSGPGLLAVLEARNGDGAQGGFVGTAGCVMRNFSDDGRMLRGVLLCDLAVDPEHRVAMSAFTIIREVRRQVLATYDLAYGFPNHLSGPVLVRAYKEIGHMSRFALLLRHRRHVEAKVAHPALAWGAARALDAARAALVRARALPARIEHRLVELDEAGVDERFDQLWREAAPAYGIVGARDRAFIRWRYLRRPDASLKVVGLENLRTGAIAGYAVVQSVGDVWHIRDIFARPADFPALLGLLCFQLLAWGATSISLCMLAPPPVAAALKACGFRERPDRRAVVIGVGKDRQTDAASLLDATRWYLTEGDEDT
jgi:hypothetical protein